MICEERVCRFCPEMLSFSLEQMANKGTCIEFDVFTTRGAKSREKVNHLCDVLKMTYTWLVHLKPSTVSKLLSPSRYQSIVFFELFRWQPLACAVQTETEKRRWVKTGIGEDFFLSADSSTHSFKKKLFFPVSKNASMLFAVHLLESCSRNKSKHTIRINQRGKMTFHISLEHISFRAVKDLTQQKRGIWNVKFELIISYCSQAKCFLQYGRNKMFF